MKKVLHQILAAITFFTRIPLWKIIEIPAESFQKIILFWPLTAWITGGITGLSWLALSQLFPPTLSIILALAIKTLLTGALHEDGLGDFFDGFGGGKTKADVLRIMKDSHIGSYALVGLIFYYLILINTLLIIPTPLTPVVIFVADPLSKMLSALMMNNLPYARLVEDSKAKTAFEKLNIIKTVLLLIFGLLPICLLINPTLWLATILPIITLLYIYRISKKTIGGYTGDVCGATALLCELSFYVGLILVLKLLP